jgi:hypothetical protein
MANISGGVSGGASPAVIVYGGWVTPPKRSGRQVRRSSIIIYSHADEKGLAVE